MDFSLDHHRTFTQEREIVTTKKRASIIFIDAVAFVTVLTLHDRYWQSDEFGVGQILFVLCNLLISKGVFFLPFFIMEFKYKEIVFSFFFIASTAVLWYLNMVEIWAFYSLILIDVGLLLSHYLNRFLLNGRSGRVD